MADELGTVISDFEGPSTTNFSFVVSGLVRKGQFVKSEMEDGTLVGMVTEISRANRYFERAESVAEYDRAGPIIANFPISDWEYTVAKVRALGVYKEGKLLRSIFPASPGSKVLKAEDEMLKEFLGFEDGGIDIGMLENHGLEAKLNLDGLFQKHLAILAMSGAGKSYLASVLIEELLDRKPEQGRLAVIAIDIHGEYLGFRSGEYAKKTEVVDGKDIRIALHKVSPQMLAEFVPHLSAAQKRDLTRIMSDFRREKKDSRELYDLKDLMGYIQAKDMKENVKGTLLSWLDSLRPLKLFSKTDRPSLETIAKPGRLAILDLSEIDNNRKKQLIVSYFANKLFNGRKKGKIPPFVLLIEESHNFAREKAQKGESLSKSVIEKIAREGRKFGASLCLVSQRPVQLSTTALSQCNTNIILRVTNPYDIDHIGESCEGIDKNMLGSITTLRVGEALVVGEAVHHPIFVKIRRRRSRPSPKGESLSSLARKFEEIQAQKSKDVEAFL